MSIKVRLIAVNEATWLAVSFYCTESSSSKFDLSLAISVCFVGFSFSIGKKKNCVYSGSSLGQDWIVAFFLLIFFGSCTTCHSWLYLLIFLSFYLFICPPPGRRPTKNHLQSKWIFSGVVILFLAQVLIFHCATPRGLIHWVTVEGNGSLLASNSTFEDIWILKYIFLW